MGEKKMERLIDKKTLSDELGLPERTITRYMKDGALPYYKIGASVRFRVSEVEKWVRERKVH